MSGLREGFDEIVADVPVYGDLERAIEQADRERSQRYALAALLAAAAAVAVIAGGLALTRDGDDSQRPIGPATTTPTPTESASATRWEPTEPLRAAASRVVQHDLDSFGDALDMADPRDVPIASIDIVSVREAIDMHGGSSWGFQLAARPPRDPVNRVISYGVVVDADGDQRADCQIGINNNGAHPGDFHVWVTNLRTHETTVDDGPGCGMPAEFSHPAEGDEDPGPPAMYFGFLLGLKHPDPCDPFDRSSTYYVWSSVTEGGRVVARDYAPDAAWLPINWEGA